ncbi:hypothetical protein G3N95_13380 [Paraburkholderia sp. Tr-20389]|nr:hypothetical protein [Paraburkholderia sp. Tr-20389]MBN3753937.1 hypothetical protein [Paraburkholderia sp. Tr-20389]
MYYQHENADASESETTEQKLKGEARAEKARMATASQTSKKAQLNQATA